MEKKIPFTQEAYDQLVKDLNNLKNVERPRVLQELVDARAQVDNVELPKLQDQLARAEVVAFDASSDTIRFGATVTVKNLKTKRDVVYQLVSPESVDALNGKISFKSPIGAALMGKKRGDKVEVSTPKGVNNFEIIDFK